MGTDHDVYEGSYYRVRAGQEEAAARAAVDLPIADIHWALAARYQIRDGVSRLHRSGIAGPHYQSALLLVESLIHALIAKSILTLPEAIEIVEMAEDVELEMARTANGSFPPQSIISLLAPIAKSLRTNLGE